MVIVVAIFLLDSVRIIVLHTKGKNQLKGKA